MGPRDLLFPRFDHQGLHFVQLSLSSGQAVLSSVQDGPKPNNLSFYFPQLAHDPSKKRCRG